MAGIFILAATNMLSAQIVVNFVPAIYGRSIDGLSSVQIISNTNAVLNVNAVIPIDAAGANVVVVVKVMVVGVREEEE